MKPAQIKKIRSLANEMLRPAGNLTNIAQALPQQLEVQSAYKRAVNPAAILTLLDHVASLEVSIAVRDKEIKELNKALDEGYP